MRARISNRCVFLVGVLFAASASAEVPYPEDWPKVAKRANGACSSIAGRYEYFGETARRPTPFPTINFDNSGFNRMSIRGWPQSALVTHAVESGEVVVTIEGKELSPPERATFARQTKCED